MLGRGRCDRSVVACLVAAWLTGAGAAWAAPASVIRNNGDPANRVDLVILGDGYTAGQLDQYAADVERFVDALFVQEPFREYQRFFNVHRVDVASNEPGADHPERTPPSLVDTALGSTYNCGGIQRLICVDVSSVYDVLGTSVSPDMRDVVVIIVNDPEYGGSGGAVAVASTHPAVVEIILHELGHSFGLLADEYFDDPSLSCDATTEPSEPNVTRETERARIKWAAWIDPGTPIPTAGPAVALPGLYEGARYCATGLFRPTDNSKMRSLGPAFEQVNTEQLVKRAYNWVSPIDRAEPPEPALTLPRGKSQTFRVVTPRPLTQGLRVEWYVDGRPVATGSDFTLQSSTLAVGTHTVQAVVRDRTPSVRRDPGGVLVDAVEWVVTVVVRAGTVTGFSGSGEGVERGPARTGIAITGTFVADGPLDLASAAAVTITRLLHEAGRIGETVAGLPLTLIPDDRNDDKVARFTSAGGAPIATLTLGSRGRGEFTFRLNVTRATSVAAGRCPDTTLTTTFVIHDRVNGDVTVSAAQRWTCFGTGHQYLRARR